MANLLGVDVPVPSVDFTGFISSTWIYVFAIAIVGLILIVTLALVLFYHSYNKKIIVFENVAGLGYQPTLRTRARIIQLGSGGEELLKTLAGGKYVTAYGRKMGKNTYWFAKGSDGYWYNVILGDLDTKMAMLDINPIDRDVRMFHVALDRLAYAKHDKKTFMEKYGSYMIAFMFLAILIGGMWLIIGRIGDATQALASTAKTNERVAELLSGVLQGASNIEGGSGIVPAG